MSVTFVSTPMVVIRILRDWFFLRPYRIFISYSRQHSELARGLHQMLTLQHETFLDAQNIKLGHDWRATLIDEIRRCTHLYVLWCAHARDSREVNAEIDTAIAERKRIVPICIGDIPLSEKLSSYQGIPTVFATICVAPSQESNELQEIVAQSSRQLETQWRSDNRRVQINRRIAILVLCLVPLAPLTMQHFHSQQPTIAERERKIAEAEKKIAELKKKIAEQPAPRAGLGGPKPKGNRESVGDGRFIVTTSIDMTARIWDALSGSEVGRLEDQFAPITQVAFGPDGRQIAITSADNTVRNWDFTTKRLISVLAPQTGQVRQAAFSPDGRRIVTASSDGTARIWDATSAKEFAVLRGHSGRIWSAVFSPDGRRVLTASEDRTARVWDADGREIAVLKGHADGVTSAAFSPDNRLVVTASADRTALIWDSEGRLVRAFVGHRAPITQATFSPDGRLILTASVDNSIKLWDVVTGSLMMTTAQNEPFVTAAFSPDGSRLVTASADGTARIWDLASGRLVAVREAPLK